MTNQQILEKAIQKAMKNGWADADREFVVKSDEKGFPYLLWQSDSGYLGTVNYHAVIFNHNFAKALWPGTIDTLSGTERKDKYVPLGTLETWKYHLQMMAIADDPIKYLGENS